MLVAFQRNQAARAANLELRRPGPQDGRALSDAGRAMAEMWAKYGRGQMRTVSLTRDVRAVTVVSHVARYLLADDALRQRHQVRLLEDPAAKSRGDGQVSAKPRRPPPTAEPPWHGWRSPFLAWCQDGSKGSAVGVRGGEEGGGGVSPRGATRLSRDRMMRRNRPPYKGVARRGTRIGFHFFMAPTPIPPYS